MSYWKAPCAWGTVFFIFQDWIMWVHHVIIHVNGASEALLFVSNLIGLLFIKLLLVCNMFQCTDHEFDVCWRKKRNSGDDCRKSGHVNPWVQVLQLAVPLQLQRKRGECSAIIKAGLGMYDKRWKLRPWWLLLPRWRPRNVISSPPHPPCVLESKGEYTAYIWIHGPWGTRYLLECQLWWVYPIFGQVHSHLGSESTYGSLMEHFAEICWVEVLIPHTFTHNHGTGSALHQRIKIVCFSKWCYSRPLVSGWKITAFGWFWDPSW